MKKIAFLLIFFISSCGYQAIYQNDNIKNFKFYKIKIEGEKEINRNIINSISLEEDQTNELLNELLLKSSFEVKGTSKNKKGQINSYRSSILINLSIIKNNKIIKNKTFSEEVVYNTKDNKFELLEYQSDIKIDLINKVVEDIILYLNL